jgi:hypothetical protein
MPEKKRIRLERGMAAGEVYIVWKPTGAIYRCWPGAIEVECEEARAVPPDAALYREDRARLWYVRDVVCVPNLPKFRDEENYFVADVGQFPFVNKGVALTAGAPPQPRFPGRRRKHGRRSS